MTKRWIDLTNEDRALIAKDRLSNPELPKREFAEKHNIKPAVVDKIQELLNFDEDSAVGALVGKILEQDNELIELSSNINNKFAKQLKSQRTLKGKDLETLDRLTNTAMKRLAILAASQKGDGDEKRLDIIITL